MHLGTHSIGGERRSGTEGDGRRVEVGSGFEQGSLVYSLHFSGQLNRTCSLCARRNSRSGWTKEAAMGAVDELFAFAFPLGESYWARGPTPHLRGRRRRPPLQPVGRGVAAGRRLERVVRRRRCSTISTPSSRSRRPSAALRRPRAADGAGHRGRAAADPAARHLVRAPRLGGRRARGRRHDRLGARSRMRRSCCASTCRPTPRATRGASVAATATAT